MSKASEWAARYRDVKDTRPAQFYKRGESPNGREWKLVGRVGDDGEPEIGVTGWPPTAAWEGCARWILDTFSDEAPDAVRITAASPATDSGAGA